MHIKVQKLKIMKYLSYTDSIASSKTTIPVLSNVLISIEDNLLFLTASNLETGIKINEGVEVIEPGAIAVNGKKLLSIIRELPDEDVILNTDEHNRLNIQSTSDKIKAKFVIAGISRDNFPEVKTEPDEEYFNIKAEEFQKMIKKVIFAISSDENKYTLTGIFMEKWDNLLNLVATDGKRLALVSRKMDELEISEETFHIPDDGIIIPRIALTEIVRFGFDGSPLKMGFSKNQIFFSYENITLASNLIEGKFPDYKKIIPAQREKYFTVEKSLLYSSIKRVSLLADESYNQIKLSILKDRLIVSSRNPAFGGAVEEIPSSYDGESIDIALNYIYLLDCLKEIESDSIRVDFENSERVISVRGESEENYINLIMPMKINI